MKFYILNDVHVEFETFDPPNVDADAIILAGDIHVKNKGLIWAREKFPEKPVIYVLGNHEFYGCAYPRQIEKLKDQASGTNVQILENETTKVRDVYILCCTLWTDFDLFGNPRISGSEASQNMTDYKKIRVSPAYYKFRSLDSVAIHNKSLKWLKEEVKKYQGEKFIIVTHHAPSLRSIPESYRTDSLSAAYASHLDSFVESSSAKLWVHGHIHTQQDYMIGNTRVICNPRGYPNEPNEDFIQDLVVDI